jgi:histone deacetylase complex regulatory component SIN3
LTGCFLRFQKRQKRHVGNVFDVPIRPKRQKSSVKNYVFFCSEERVRDDYEDSRFEMDMLLAWVTSATEAAEKLMNEINGGYNSENPIRIEEHLSAMNLRFIQELYGEEGINLVEILKENPRDALPVIVPRLRQKLEEIKEWSTSFSFNNYSQAIQFNNYF